ncbi:hypothetical protein VTK56DRAFT_9891 [Thermocarpiscus australiensis]
MLKDRRASKGRITPLEPPVVWRTLSAVTISLKYVTERAYTVRNSLYFYTLPMHALRLKSLFSSLSSDQVRPCRRCRRRQHALFAPFLPRGLTRIRAPSPSTALFRRSIGPSPTKGNQGAATCIRYHLTEPIVHYPRLPGACRKPRARILPEAARNE